MEHFIPLNPIKGLKETLLPKSIEDLIEEKRDDSGDEECFTLLKESIEEDNEFCEQLMENYHKASWLSSACKEKKSTTLTFKVIRGNLPYMDHRILPLPILE
jgi:hypothetical protein